MKNEEFSFKFPELDLEFNEIMDSEYKSTIETINEYLDRDIDDQNKLLKKLRDFEARIDL